MFLFRCVFWLSLVYASILLKPSGFALPSVADADRDAKARFAVDAAGTVLRSCALLHGVCQNQAARLTVLIDKLEHAGPREQ